MGGGLHALADAEIKGVQHVVCALNDGNFHVVSNALSKKPWHIVLQKISDFRGDFNAGGAAAAHNNAQQLAPLRLRRGRKTRCV